MVRSLALVLGVVGVVALITVRGSSDAVREISYAEGLVAARSAAPYDVLAPEGLDGYQTTSVRYREVDGTTVWHLGFLTPEGDYAGLDQVDAPSADYLEDFVTDLTEGAVADGAEVTLGGEVWQRYDGGGSSANEHVRGLLRTDAGASALVSGTAAWAELERLAGALDAG